MGYTKQNFKNGQTLDAEHLIKIEDAILENESAITNVNPHITYIASTDTNNLINLRDLASGTYVLYGKFRPYAESTATLSFASDLLVNVITKTSGTHVQVFYPVNNCVQFLNITDDSYERTNVYLNDLLTHVGTLTDLTTEEKTSLVGAINELVQKTIEVDATLTVSGAAADAKAVGDKFDFFRKYHSAWIETNTGVYIDTTAKTLTFGANTYITYGSQLYNVSNTTHDISTMIGGSWVFLDFSKQPYTLTKDRNADYAVLLGALWKPNHMSDLHMDKTKLYVDGMPITYMGKYHNKTINCLGDSMTEGVGTTKAYHQWFGQLCGFKTINNYGLGGSCIAPKVDEIPTWEDGIQSFYERYESMSAADVITVFGGVNDWITGRELGTISDTTTNTFYGAMKALCAGLIAKYPTSDIFVFSSPQCDYIHRPANNLSGTEWAGNTEGYNRKGYKLQDYINAMEEVCGMYGIPFYSMYKNLFWGLSGVLGVYDSSGNGAHEASAYGSDSLHPNAEGHKKIALKMAGFINSN